MSDEHPRPRPQYGEYATPEEQRAAIKKPSPEQLGAMQYGEVTDAAPQAPGTTHPPHPPAPYQPGAYPPPPQQSPYHPYQPYQRPYPESRPQGPGVGDRIATLLLLGFGLYTVLDMVEVAVAGGPPTEDMATSGSAELAAALPGWVWTGAAVVYVVVWFVGLFASIGAIRAHRRAFWVPLVAGLVAVVLLLALMTIAIGQDPSILQHVPTTPDQVPNDTGMNT
ncbi:DUF6264 family protein [Gryllotalpicola ginsengisoli]|uniref:DUF6264 family protein n=1 Tax=Gryllotalpicola ginsengisoli TaxID=444608 RepID=UPI0003B5E49B|nr:DUF6264 family protein [Gryllotalpicola ginsengisoli]